MNEKSPANLPVSETRSFSPIQVAAAWGVHIFTASGAFVAFMTLMSIFNKDWHQALIWLFIALVIDGLDGTLARKAQVKQVVSRIDGKQLDYVVDFLNFAFVPAVFIYLGGFVPEQFGLLTVIAVLIAACYHHSNTAVVTKDYYFLGFPSQWNIVVFFLFIMQLGSYYNLLVIYFFCLLHFLPIKFIYLSRTVHLKKVTISLAAIWIMTVIVILFQYPDIGNLLMGISLVFPIYYLTMSLINTFKDRELSR